MLVKLPEQIAGFVCYIKNKKNRRTIMKQAASNKIANSPLHLIQKYLRKHRAVIQNKINLRKENSKKLNT